VCVCVCVCSMQNKDLCTTATVLQKPYTGQSALAGPSSYEVD